MPPFLLITVDASVFCLYYIVAVLSDIAEYDDEGSRKSDDTGGIGAKCGMR